MWPAAEYRALHSCHLHILIRSLAYITQSTPLTSLNLLSHIFHVAHVAHSLTRTAQVAHVTDSAIRSFRFISLILHSLTHSLRVISLLTSCHTSRRYLSHSPPPTQPLFRSNHLTHSFLFCGFIIALSVAQPRVAATLTHLTPLALQPTNAAFFQPTNLTRSCCVTPH